MHAGEEDREATGQRERQGQGAVPTGGVVVRFYYEREKGPLWGLFVYPVTACLTASVIKALRDLPSAAAATVAL